jgi:hypothetical protein
MKNSCLHFFLYVLGCYSIVAICQCNICAYAMYSEKLETPNTIPTYRTTVPPPGYFWKQTENGASILEKSVLDLKFKVHEKNSVSMDEKSSPIDIIKTMQELDEKGGIEYLEKDKQNFFKLGLYFGEINYQLRLYKEQGYQEIQISEELLKKGYPEILIKHLWIILKK